MSLADTGIMASYRSSFQDHLARDAQPSNQGTMAKEKAQKAAVKVRKKVWLQIIATKAFREAHLGQTYVYEPKEMLGKVIQVNLMTLLSDMKRQNISLSFKVIDVQGDRAYAEPYTLEMLPTSLRRLVRRDRDRADVVVTTLTKDQRGIVVKLVFITRHNTKGSVLTKMRRQAVTFVHTYVQTRPVEEIVLDAVYGKIQKLLKDVIKKTYPLRVCEVRVLKVLPEGAQKKIKAVVISPADLQALAPEEKPEEAEAASAEGEEVVQAEQPEPVPERAPEVIPEPAAPEVVEAPTPEEPAAEEKPKRKAAKKKE